MTSTVTLVRRNVRFAVTGRQTILEAALKAGVDIAYSCQQGTCGTCRSLVVSGEVEMEQQDDTCVAIGPKAIARGYRLLCISIPRSEHVEIDC